MNSSRFFTQGITTIALTFVVSCGNNSNTTSKEMASMSTQATASEAGTSDAQGKFARMSFDKVEHDFGTITAGTPQETVFTFKNIGDAPLLITNARSSCGCTVPDYPRNTPIAPGETGELLVKFNGTGINQVTKTITLTTNTKAGIENLRITAFIQPESATAFDSPLNK
jgi:hypothetical protein